MARAAFFDSAMRCDYCRDRGPYAAVVLSSGVVLCMRCYCTRQVELDFGVSPSDIAVDFVEEDCEYETELENEPELDTSDAEAGTPSEPEAEPEPAVRACGRPTGETNLEPLLQYQPPSEAIFDRYRPF